MVLAHEYFTFMQSYETLLWEESRITVTADAPKVEEPGDAPHVTNAVDISHGDGTIDAGESKRPCDEAKCCSLTSCYPRGWPAASGATTGGSRRQPD
jgi:hypothetical protein